MDFIFDQFVELTTGKKTFYVAMSSITIVEPVEVDTCDVYWSGGGVISGVKMPARVLIQKIAQRRQGGQKFLRALFRSTEL